MQTQSEFQNYFFIIDGTALMYRSFYAIQSLQNSHGQMTNALYGFIKSMDRMQKQYQPAHWVVVFDAPGLTFRDEISQIYKANRKPMPDDLINQIPLIHQYLELCKVPVLEIAGVEADDVMATLVKEISKQDMQVILVTQDKDLMQMVSDRVWMLTANLDQFFKEKDVIAKYDVKPSQIQDLLSLMGDSADNIPGVPGVGSKTASQLIRQFGSIEGVLSHVDQISSDKVRALIQNHLDEIHLSQSLVQLKTDVSIDDLSLKTFQVQVPDVNRLSVFYQEMEFNSFLREIKIEGTFKDEKQIINLDQISQPEVILNDELSFYHLQRIGDDGIKLWISQVNSPSVYLCSLKNKEVLQALRKDFQEKKWITFGFKESMRILDPVGLRPRLYFDCEIAGLLLKPSDRMRDFEFMVAEFLGQGAIATELERLIALERLYAVQFQMISEKKIEKLYFDIELPLILILWQMEQYGVAVDMEFIEKLSQEMSGMIEVIKKKVFKISGCEFNLNSTKELSKILFDDLKLPKRKRTKMGYSTDSSVLESLSDLHPIAQLMLEYRQIEKLRSTYVDALPELVVKGKLHTTFHQLGAATGRLSSSSPNLQNIPIRTEYGKRIRRIFIPSEPGLKFLSADYSQIELRVLAHMANDLAMIQAFQNDEDIHTTTAMNIFGLNKKDDVSSEQRHIAKAVNFGIAYGQSAFGLAKMLHISIEEAQHIIEKYFERFSGIQVFLQKLLEDAKKVGFSATLFHRCREIPELKAKQPAIRALGERIAINSPIQGTAADIIKLAMIEIAKLIQNNPYRSRMLLQIHDELLFEVYPDELILFQEEVRRIMENVVQLKSGLKVNIEIGNNWSEL